MWNHVGYHRQTLWFLSPSIYTKHRPGTVAEFIKKLFNKEFEIIYRRNVPNLWIYKLLGSHKFLCIKTTILRLQSVVEYKNQMIEDYIFLNWSSSLAFPWSRGKTLCLVGCTRYRNRNSTSSWKMAWKPLLSAYMETACMTSEILLVWNQKEDFQCFQTLGLLNMITTETWLTPWLVLIKMYCVSVYVGRSQ